MIVNFSKQILLFHQFQCDIFFLTLLADRNFNDKIFPFKHSMKAREKNVKKCKNFSQIAHTSDKLNNLSPVRRVKEV